MRVTENLKIKMDSDRRILGLSDQVAKGLLSDFQLQLRTDCASVEIIQILNLSDDHVAKSLLSNFNCSYASVEIIQVTSESC